MSHDYFLNEKKAFHTEQCITPSLFHILKTCKALVTICSRIMTSFGMSFSSFLLMWDHSIVCTHAGGAKTLENFFRVECVRMGYVTFNFCSPYIHSVITPPVMHWYEIDIPITINGQQISADTDSQSNIQLCSNFYLSVFYNKFSHKKYTLPLTFCTWFW